jgi:hypothetical protein
LAFPHVYNSIPPSSPSEPRRHPDSDLDAIIKLLDEIRNFLDQYIKYYIPYLIHDGLDDLVPGFINDSIPIIHNNTNRLITILAEQPPTDSLRNSLQDTGLTGSPLIFKDKSIRAHINRFFKYIKYGAQVLRKAAGKVFDVFNSFLGSLKEALTAIGGIGGIVDAIKQIKDHLKAAST